MTVIILIIIYLAFISLGLPDPILGTALPAICRELNIELSTGGLISMVIMGGTIVSSFLSGHVIARLGTARVTFVSALMTAMALLGFSLAPSFWLLLLLAIPLGLGGGSVDTALNNYVALNFNAIHMNWLHSFWGVGATLGPLIMGAALLSSGNWRAGYQNISLMQTCLALLLLLTIPLWRGKQGTEEEKSSEKKGSATKHHGVGYAFATVFLYCSVEIGLGLWGSSFMVATKGMPLERAAFWMSFYYGGITAGRFMSGVVSLFLSNRQLIRAGVIISLGGLILLTLPLPPALTGLAFILTGLGLAPIFPAMLHETPARFGEEHSQKLIGYQMGFAYTGSTLFPPLLGFILRLTGMDVFPLIILTAAAAMLFSSEMLNRVHPARTALREEA